MAKEAIDIDPSRDVVVSIRGVEPTLATAVKKLEKRLGRPLKGIDVVDSKAAIHKYYQKDVSGTFEQIVCDFDDDAALQQALKPYMDTALVSTCRLEEGMKDFSRAMHYLPYISTPSAASVAWCTQKSLMRDKLHTYDPSLVPKYTTLTEYDQEALSDAIEGFTFPVVVKPNGLHSSLLVSRCDTREVLDACLARTFEVIYEVYEQTDGTGQPSVLVEEMMQGGMYSVDAYMDAEGSFYSLPPVNIVTAHSLGLPGGFYAYRRSIPTGLNDEQLGALYETARASMRALSLSSTTAHIELYLTESGWKIIELGPRMGGYRQVFYQEAYGIDHHYNDLLVRIGLEPEIPRQLIKHVAGVSIYANEEGVIEAIDGIEDARQLSSTVMIGVQAKVGDMALFADSGGELIVDAILSNEDPEKLEADVARLRELVTIKVEPRQVV